MRNFKKRIKDEDGEIMLESMLVMLIVIFILIAMLSFGFLFYQQSMLCTVANELAEDIGANYKLACSSDQSGKPEQKSLREIKLYRTSFAIFSIKEMHKQRANDYLPKRVRLTSLGILDDEPKVENFDIKVDNIGRLHVEVTVSMKCSILFDGALKYFGIIKETPKFTATGRAECLDITAYASHVHFVKYVGDKIAADKGNISTILNQIVDTLNNTKSIAEVFGH